MYRFILGIVAAALLGGCSAPEPPLRIGVLVWPPYELAFLARDRGYFSTDDIELVNYQSPAEVLRAYRYGMIDGMFLTSQFVLGSRPYLDDIRLVYAINISLGGDSVLARREPGIHDLQALEERNIAVEATPLGGYMLQRVLDHSSLKRSQLNIHYIDTPNHFSALQQHRVDAVITYEPTRTKLLQQGAVELFNSSQLPNEIIDVLLVSRQSLSAREPALRQFVRGLSRACALLENAGRATLQPLAQRQGLNIEAFRATLDHVALTGLEENRSLLSGSPPLLLSHLRLQAEVMQRAGLYDKSGELTALIDNRLVASQ